MVTATTTCTKYMIKTWWMVIDGLLVSFEQSISMSPSLLRKCIKLLSDIATENADSDNTVSPVCVQIERYSCDL